MRILHIPEPVSGGLFLSYRCNSECKHCMYACSPRWSADWISKRDAEIILTQLAPSIRGSPLGRDHISLNCGIHLTGGEPFLNFDLLLDLSELVNELDIPSSFVETNCSWCIDDETTRESLLQLKYAGLRGILISVNPFILEYVPPQRIRRGIMIGREIFGENTLIYQEYVYRQFERLDPQNVISLPEYLKATGPRSLSYLELLPFGRTPYRLGSFYHKYPAECFFGKSCKSELRRNWHIHIDNYGNYMPGYCGGISLGDARDLHSILNGVDLDKLSIIEALTEDLESLYGLGRGLGYEALEDGYILKCHLCLDIRRWIAQSTDGFSELSPREFYDHLE